MGPLFVLRLPCPGLNFTCVGNLLEDCTTLSDLLSETPAASRGFWRVSFFCAGLDRWIYARVRGAQGVLLPHELAPAVVQGS